MWNDGIKYSPITVFKRKKNHFLNLKKFKKKVLSYAIGYSINSTTFMGRNPQQLGFFCGCINNGGGIRMCFCFIPGNDYFG